MASPAKIGALALVGSCATAGCAGGIYLTSGTPIKDIIKEEYQYILLDTTEGTSNKDTTKWGEVWKSYKADGKNVFNLEGWVAGQDALDLTSKLKQKCNELSGSKVSSKESTLYKNVTKYCARGVTFEEQAAKDRLTILDTSTTNKDSKIWTKRHGAKTQITTHLNKLEIKGTLSDGNAIKDGCSKAKDKNKQIENYEDVYTSYKLVCTKQPGDDQD